MMEHLPPRRKKTRLQNYNYCTPGYYFLTVCTKRKVSILSSIWSDSLGAAHVKTTPTGEIVETYIQSIENAYKFVKVDKYVIMPNHIHLLLHMEAPSNNAPCPTDISSIIRCLKRFTNRDTGEDLWQSSFYDHIIRNEADYLRIWQYIDDNPGKWSEDKYFCRSP